MAGSKYNANAAIIIRTGCEMKTNTNAGITLIELVVGFTIASLIIAALMNFTSTGLRGTNKGMAHLSIMQSASILMAQIEYDILRASQVVSPAPGVAASAVQLRILTDDDEGRANVIYSDINTGIERRFDNSTINNSYIFCRDMQTTISFRQARFTDTINSTRTIGMWIELTVTAPEKFGTKEEFSMKRLIMCKNILELL